MMNVQCIESYHHSAAVSRAPNRQTNEKFTKPTNRNPDPRFPDRPKLYCANSIQNDILIIFKTPSTCLSRLLQ